jgi:renalase
MIPIVIIGAGIAGLACARRLADAGVAALLLDKGRGVGGRVATRRMGDMQFDHGAQYVTAQNAGFAALLNALGKAGSLADWHDGSGRKHSVGTPGMSAIPKALGVGLDIRQGTQVARLVEDGEGWKLHTDDGVLRCRRVVVTVPAPQVAGLLGPDHPLVAALAPVQMAPCLTLMAAITAPAPFVTRQDRDDPLAWIAQDSTKPGRPQTDAALWVAQAGEAFSQAHIEKDAKAIADAVLSLLCDRLGVSQDRVTQAVAHRWRYARVTQALGLPFLRSPDASLYLGGDWCIGARVEAAWDSGTAIADDILARE